MRISAHFSARSSAHISAPDRLASSLDAAAAGAGGLVEFHNLADFV